MDKRFLTAAISIGLCFLAHSEEIKVTAMKYAGPFKLSQPFMVDSVDVNSKKFDQTSLISTPISLELANNGTDLVTPTLPSADGTAIHLLTFTIDNERYVKGALKIDGAKNREIYLDGTKIDNEELCLVPATHRVTIKCLTDGINSNNSIGVSIICDRPDLLTIGNSDKRRYTIRDVMTGRRFWSANLSPSGKYLLTYYYYTHDGGNNTYSSELTECKTGRKIATNGESLKWMPKSDKLYFTREVNGKIQLLTFDPEDSSESIIAWNIPERNFIISPTEDFLVYTKEQKGPKEKSADLYEIINPEDRQPGWRDRGVIMKYNMATGLSVPLTFGFRNVAYAGLSDDGNKLLFSTYESRLEKRPTTLTSLYLLNLVTNDCKQLIDKEGFIGTARLSPDGKSVALVATPESFGGIGKILPEGMTPSMTDNQLYVMDIEKGDITALTRDFHPSVESFAWNRNDGNIYFTAENRDLISLYRANPQTDRIENLGAQEENVFSFSTASSSPLLVYFGQGANNSDRLYSLNTKNLRHNLIKDLSAERLDGIMLGKCEGWDFKTSRGDSICARYILPPDFDSSRKYPMIVNYYGGCSPTSRTMESRYPHHLYAANGYVVLVIIPSGSTGFGQEFAARHVNTAGEGVAEDIIEGVKQFCETHPWVDKNKIGCIGASYGGFMTQYLQTKTDIFAAAISHAGISDHTSYWGEGYWGYSYSEVSMANSYPWTHPDLYVKRSPLYNADKIHTPILFLHGDADTNVPVGESIQMYTALKLLGRETAFVAVKDANHQIMEFNKRAQWQNTIFAWFAKYLQDDPTWWESLYPTKAMR